MKKIIVAQLSILDDKIEEFLSLAETMAENSSNEEGCISYKLLDAVATKGEYFFHEVYQDDAAVEAHNNSDHFINFIAAITPLLSKAPVIDVY